jgi:hypothetical protein
MLSGLAQCASTNMHGAVTSIASTLRAQSSGITWSLDELRKGSGRCAQSTGNPRQRAPVQYVLTMHAIFKRLGSSAALVAAAQEAAAQHGACARGTAYTAVSSEPTAPTCNSVILTAATGHLYTALCPSVHIKLNMTRAHAYVMKQAVAAPHILRRLAGIRCAPYRRATLKLKSHNLRRAAVWALAERALHTRQMHCRGVAAPKCHARCAAAGARRDGAASAAAPLKTSPPHRPLRAPETLACEMCSRQASARVDNRCCDNTPTRPHTFKLPPFVSVRC